MSFPRRRLSKSSIRTKFNRGTIAAAKKLAKSTGNTNYVYGVHGGFVIGKEPPFFGQQHLIVKPNGEVTKGGMSFGREEAQS